MATMAENVIAAENGEMLRDSVEHGPYKFKSEITVKDTDGVTDIRRAERIKDLKGDDKLRYDSDIKAPGESIHSYYLIFAKLINDMNMIPMSMTPMQINTKFVNHLQPEWSRFVMAAKQARNLHSVNVDQMYAFLKHNKRDAKEVLEMRQRFPEPLALLANTYNPPPSYNMYRSKFPPTNNQLRTSSNPRTQATIQNGQVTVQNVQGANQPRDKMLLAQAQEAGAVLDEEHQDFLADSLEETNDCEDLQLQATTNFKADHVDAYDSDCDDEATANAIFMENLSHVGSLNDDTVAPRYDSDTLFEVPQYDTYHDSDMLNSNIQELGYIENIISNNESYDELKGNNDVISYTDYMLTIGNNKDNYVPPLVQKNDMMLSVIEQMKSQVEKCNKVNQDSKSEIESLTSELERYKDRVRVLGYAVKDDHSKQEAYLSQTRMRYSIAKSSLIRAHINIYGHPFNPPNFSFVRNSVISEQSSWNFRFLGLGHNLFSVGQFCDSNLEVAFRKHTCFARNLEGVDLLLGSRGSNLYTISMADMMKSSPICLLSKASKTKSWLWHCRLSHLNFGMSNGNSKKESHPHKPEPSTNEKLQMLHMDLYRLMRVESINKKRYILVIVDDYSRFTWVKFLRTKDEAPEIIIKFFKQAQVSLNTTVRYLRIENGTEFLNQTLRNYTDDVGITHNTSTARTPQQNGVVERRNRTLVEAARTMLIFSKSLLFLWAEAVATTCYTQNRSLIHTCYNKTPYELLRDRKPELKHLHIFGALCYPTNDFEDIRKL
ncbi:retrovirus-related pol polyprotein from transposon TNT 1-94 [Tanacetum coccineum]|uniref:Retrovirus-related pol polyprotein from transposon TNT 1-94 n=1 Tax=Tanacetum coccineum TaxID=301880 RepID=A0ABQ5DWV4_9ASTR